MMNWESFIHAERVEGVGVPREKSHAGSLLELVHELAEKSTLANWVRETDGRLSSGRQLTLSAFA